MKILLLSLVLVTFLAGSVGAAPCLVGDLDDDCDVDEDDLQIFAEQWLDDPGGSANLDDVNGVNMFDFALLAAQWGKSGIPLVINEFMASNNSESDINDPQGDYDDWVEIYNFGDTAIDIGGMYLTDDLDEPTKWQIPNDVPAETTVGAYGYLLIWADGDTDDGPLHADFKLDADGEQIGLFDTDGSTLIDGIIFGEQVANISYGCYPDANDDLRFFATPTPLADNNGAYLGLVEAPEFSHERGFYETGFDVTIATTTDGIDIYYTTDGSEPIVNEQPSASSTEYIGAIYIGSTTCLRAAAIKTGWMPSRTTTHTYIFVSDVITQSPSGGKPDPNWPAPYDGSDPETQWIDYGMDPDVVNDACYIELVDDALLALPTISIVTNLNNLFNPTTGIYMNPRNEGIAWERPTSVELIYPDGSEGFQIDAGLRIRGGWSRHEDYPKHAFRLFFRSKYGEAKLRYPLFGTEGVDEFENMDLRTSQNYSWSYYCDSQNTMVRDVFSRYMQRDMGQPYTRSRYYHLYINGQYWGLFQTQERSEASYAASYFGGENEDYDVIKVDGWPSPADYEIMATDGNLAAYEDLWQAATAGFSTDAAYYGVQGLKPDGTYDPSGIKLVDIDNLIDYMLCVYYTGDKDGPISSFRSNKRPNNLWAIYNRNKPDGFKFLRHDCEHVLDTGFNDRTGPYDNPFLRQFRYFTPQWLSQELTAHPEYVMRFADRVHKYFFNGSVLTPQSMVAYWTARAYEIDLAIIAESARWGDAKCYPPRTKDDDWLPAINNVTNNYLPSRSGVVLDQFRAKGWYPDVSAPVFNINGSYQHGGYISPSDLFSITANGNPIWYTMDGTDPRLPGGGVSPTAIEYTGPITFSESIQVKARVLDGATWSALNEVIYAIGPVVDNVRITEIMYHPKDTGSPNDPNTEYIELTNIGASTINLNLVRFTEGIHFTFSPLELEDGDHVVVVKNQAAFEAQYPAFSGLIAGEYSGRLANGGERIRLEDANGQTILDFKYKDGWRPITDGDGYSLTIVDATSPDVNSWDEKDSWRASAHINGSPGADDSGIVPNPSAIVINEVMAHTDTYPNDWIELYSATAGPIDISGWYLSDSDTNLMKYEFASGTVIDGYGYLVLSEDFNFGASASDPGKHIPFALSENGEMVCLTSALDANGVLTGYRQREDFGASETGVSFGRYYKASTNNFNFVAMDYNTPELANAYPKVGPIVINEIMYHPDWPAGGSYENDQYEYIELYNTSSGSVTLYDYAEGEPWKFTDGIDFTFPASPNEVTVPAGGYILVVKNPAAFAWRYPGVSSSIVFGPYDGKLANGGEKVQIGMPGDEDAGTRYYIRVDRVSYSDGSHPQDCPGGVDLWPTEADGGVKSLTRTNPELYGNDPNNWTGASPSPGS